MSGRSEKERRNANHETPGLRTTPTLLVMGELVNVIQRSLKDPGIPPNFDVPPVLIFQPSGPDAELTGVLIRNNLVDDTSKNRFAYDLLPRVALLQRPEWMSMITTAWVAPDFDQRPSRHPKRQEIVSVYTVMADGDEESGMADLVRTSHAAPELRNWQFARHGELGWEMRGRFPEGMRRAMAMARQAPTSSGVTL